MEENKPNYWGISPADVRYDNRLNDKAKLLYIEFTALTNKEGYCWATNSYFANLYNVTTRTISKMINQLKEYGYINVVMVYEPGTKQIKQRQIWLNNSIPMENNFHTPMERKFQDNITSVNITTTIDGIESPPTPVLVKEKNNLYNGNQQTTNNPPSKEDVLSYGKTVGSTIDLDYFFNYYSASDWKDKGGNLVNWKQKLIQWGRLEKPKNQSKQVILQQKPKKVFSHSKIK